MHDTDAVPAVADWDEDSWEAPAAWWERGFPVRGLSPQQPITLDGSAASALADIVLRHHVSLTQLFDGIAGSGSSEIAAAAKAAMTDPETCSPLGAAVLAYVVDGLISRSHYGGSGRTVDAWVSTRGLGFAAEAVVHELDLRMGSGAAALVAPYLRSVYKPWHRIHSLHINIVRVRHLLAHASDAEYRQVVARLGELRNQATDTRIRIATSFLAPTEREWVAEDTRHPIPNARFDRSAALLLASAGTSAELTRIVEALQEDPLADFDGWPALYTALARFGAGCAPLVDRLIDQPDLESAEVSALTYALAQLPSDYAFSALLARIDRPRVPPVIDRTVRRYPRRALRLLPPVAKQSALGLALLRLAARAVPPTAPEAAAVADLLAGPSRIADRTELPEVLRIPPWERPRTRIKPLVLPDLVAPRPNSLDWAPGEREECAQQYVPLWDSLRADWSASLAGATTQDSYALPYLFVHAPEELMRPLLATTGSGPLWDGDDILPRVLARFGDEALPYVLAMVQSRAGSHGQILAPVTGTAVTALMMRWLDSKKAREHALTWFDRHLATALPELIAAALSKPGKHRLLAESALRALADRGHRAAIDSAAARFGDQVAEAIGVALDTDPLLRLPARIPALPKWLDPHALPPLALRDSGAALPVSAVRDVCVMLALCGPHGDYAGVAAVSEALDPKSRAEFAWGLFESWRLADYPSKDGWILHALGLFGDDETARRLGPWIRRWPGESSHARAVAGLDALLVIGTDIALMQLHRISERVKFKGIRTSAQEKIAELAAGLELTPEELADRLVPDFGLDAHGTLELDYGPRGFVVSFDEHLTPILFDAVRTGEDGWQPTTIRKTLPKPTATDDPDLAPAAYKSFTTLKKEVKSAAAGHIRRFERALAAQRRWSVTDHHRLFVEHPLLWQVTRRLVWATFDSDGAVTGSFRMAEDRTYADATDETITVPATATLGIAHPLHLGQDLPLWSELFADYEILQPFPQLHRDIHSLTPEERTATTLPRFQDRQAPAGRLLNLAQRGWRRGDYMEDIWSELSHDVDCGTVLIRLHDGGLISSRTDRSEKQPISVHLVARTSAERTPVFGDLDPITASELLRDLTILTA
ncbi:DUF4132 domain-containing protein [Nocardia sp. 2]|uniref:DUF4132 domain-containing protein n=1 Tax=Nocardia acididurans TaxID=2802282 RepID=A0ABS1MIN7_9NOCA|nr:DUF4132 domain-containing protein [Nocardia acididurans]MBL1080136.1 DUF4132 domain-containing protein [Nocardia acididurans]